MSRSVTAGMEGRGRLGLERYDLTARNGVRRCRAYLLLMILALSAALTVDVTALGQVLSGSAAWIPVGPALPLLAVVNMSAAMMTLLLAGRADNVLEEAGHGEA